MRLDHLLSREINLLERQTLTRIEGRSPSGRCPATDDSPQHPVPGVAPAYLESRIAIGERWKRFSSRLDSFLRFKDRMIAIIHPIQTRRIHLYMSEEHLIASTVKAVPRYEIPELRHTSAIHDID